MNKTVKVNINGKVYVESIDVRLSLLNFLRDKLGLTGTKHGCGVGECGACTVMVDGVNVDSCIYLAMWVDGKEVTTIEGIHDENGDLSKVQTSFVEKGAVQCGFCTPGLVISATALLKKDKKPSREKIRRGISGNMCRCTGYSKIIDAIEGCNE